MTKQSFDSWLLPQVAIENDNTNREYFEKGTVEGFPYFYKLRDIITLITSSESCRMLSCLDVGCGAGWQAKYLEMVGFGPILQYEGLDISSHMCERARQNFPDGTFYVADILEFSPGKIWDIVMACGSIEHFADWKLFLTKLAELSSKWIIIHKVFFTDKNAPTWVFERIMYCGLKEIRVVMNFEEFSLILDNLGFEIVHKYGWEGVSSIVARRKYA